MLEHSRRTFVRLGALAAAGPLVGKLIPVPLAEARAVAREDLFVTIRARLVPVLSSGAALGEHATMVNLAWADTRIPLLARATVAAHDSLRELMEGVAPSQEITRRDRPAASLTWYTQLFYVSWQLGHADRDHIAHAERALFATLDDSPAVSTDGRRYNVEATRQLGKLAAVHGSSVDVRLPCIVRLDQPHSWGWSRRDLKDPVASAAAIARHLSGSFLPTVESLVRNPRQWTRRMQLAAAMTNLPSYAHPRAQRLASSMR